MSDRDPWREAAAADPRWRITPTKWLVGAILLVGIIVPILVGTYAKDGPRVFGFPFFYWYQLLWVFLAAGICALSYTLLRREARAFDAAHSSAGPDDGEQP